MRYLFRRIGHALLLLFGVSVVLFLLFQATPGDFLSDAQLNGRISADTLQALRAQYGLDQPMPVRYVRWINSAAHGDFGYSFAYNVQASYLLWPRVLNTLLLTLPALLISWLIAVPLGVLAAARRGGWLDRWFSGSTSVLLALPDLLLGLLALLIALKSHAFPVGGMTSTSLAQEHPSRIGDIAWHMLLPVMALVISSLAPLMRQVRSSVADAMATPYYRAAQGHGLRPFTLWFRHALPAAANPLISLFGLSIGFLLSSSLLIEVIMSWPGMGPLFLEAIMARDFFLVLGSVMFITLFLVVGNFLADILLYMFDPRIRMQA